MVHYHWSWILIILWKILTGLMLRVVSSFLPDPTLNISVKPHLQKALPCGHPCHTWDLGLGTVSSGKYSLPCSQRLRLHGCTSTDLGLGTPCEPVCRWRGFYRSPRWLSGNIRASQALSFLTLLVGPSSTWTQSPHGCRRIHRLWFLEQIMIPEALEQIMVPAVVLLHKRCTTQLFYACCS